MNRTCGSTATVVMLLAAPAAAFAETFCVHDPAGCVGVDEAGPPGGAERGQCERSGSDTISFGAGLFDDGPAVNLVGNPVDIIGTALNQTAIRSAYPTPASLILDIGSRPRRSPACACTTPRTRRTRPVSSSPAPPRASDVTNQSLAGQFDGITTVGASASLDDSAVPPTTRTTCKTGPLRCWRRRWDDPGLEPERSGGLERRRRPGADQRTRIRATQGVVASGGASVQVRTRRSWSRASSPRSSRRRPSWPPATVPPR